MVDFKKELDKKKKILIVQPHSDDVLFSASKFLFQKDKYKQVKILTLECGNEKRLEEDFNLCELFQIDYDNLGFDFEDDSYYQYYKKDGHKKFFSEECLSSLQRRYGDEFLNTIKKKLVKTIKKYKEDGWEIIVPLGIGHPMHWFVMDCLKKYANLFYRDFPHSYKMKTKDAMNNINEFTLASTYFDEDEHAMKFQISYDVYKSQRSLLFFEKGYIEKQIPEEFYQLRRETVDEN